VLFLFRAARKTILAALFFIASFSVSLACSGIDSVSPASGPAAGGTVVTITGSGYHCATIEVKFGGRPATSFSAINDSTITATVPAGTGTVDVTVVINGTPHTLAAGYRYISPDDGKRLDSENARSLQTGITAASATISAQIISSQIDGAIADAFNGNGNAIVPNANGVTFNFAAESQQSLANRANAAFAAFAAAPGAPRGQSRSSSPLMREWSAWLDLRGTGFETNTTNADIKGRQYNITAGIGRMLAPDLLVGIVAGYEHMKYDSAALAGGIRSDGGNVGGYLGWRIAPALRVDAALTYGRIAYSALAGSAAGSFDGNRLVAAGGLVGTHHAGDFVIEPSARIHALWERQSAWTDTLGTAQAGRTFSAGRISGGAKVIKPFSYREITITPYVGLFGDYRFSSDNALPAGNPIVGIGDGWTGRVTSGLGWTGPNGTSLGIAGEYAGIGGAYKIWSGNIRASVPF
jgi:hypothetical protein